MYILLVGLTAALLYLVYYRYRNTWIGLKV